MLSLNRVISNPASSNSAFQSGPADDGFSSSPAAKGSGTTINSIKRPCGSSLSPIIPGLVDGGFSKLTDFQVIGSSWSACRALGLCRYQNVSAEGRFARSGAQRAPQCRCTDEGEEWQ